MLLKNLLFDVIYIGECKRFFLSIIVLNKSR